MFINKLMGQFRALRIHKDNSHSSGGSRILKRGVPVSPVVGMKKVGGGGAKTRVAKQPFPPRKA